MPLYRVIRQRVQDLMIEVSAASPEQAVRLAYKAVPGAWQDCDGAGLSPIGAVSEADRPDGGRCWGVSGGEFGGTVRLLEVTE